MARNRKKNQQVSRKLKAVNRKINQIAQKTKQQPAKRRTQRKRGPPSLIRSAITDFAGKWGFKNLASKGLDILGVGDYVFPDGTVQREPPPTRIVRKEYVKDILSSVDFSVWSHDINPTHADLFPWLSQIAGSYNKYKFIQLAFHYKPTSGNAISSTNNALGLVGMVVNPDPAKPEYGSKQQAETAAMCRTCKPSDPFFFGVECDPNKTFVKRFFTNTGDVGSEDPKLYFPGKLNVFTDGMQVDNIKVGELWVEYAIELTEPQLLQNGTNNASVEWSAGVNTVISNNQLCGPNPDLVRTGDSNLDISLTNDTPMTIRWGAATPAGRYLVHYICEGATSSFKITAGANTSNLSFTNLCGFGGNITAPDAASTDQAKSFTGVFVKSDDNAASCQLYGSAVFASSTGRFYMCIVPLHTNLESLRLFKEAKLSTRVSNVLHDLFKVQGVDMNVLMRMLANYRDSEEYDRNVVGERKESVEIIASKK